MIAESGDFCGWVFIFEGWILWMANRTLRQRTEQEREGWVGAIDESLGNIMELEVGFAKESPK